MLKTANVLNGAKRLVENAKNVKENRVMRDQLSTEMANLNRKVQLNGITKNPEDSKRAAELMDEMQNITRDVRTGEAIRYGVPGAAMFGGAAWGGKKLADSKKNNE